MEQIRKATGIAYIRGRYVKLWMEMIIGKHYIERPSEI